MRHSAMGKRCRLASTHPMSKWPHAVRRSPEVAVPWRSGSRCVIRVLLSRGAVAPTPPGIGSVGQRQQTNRRFDVDAITVPGGRGPAFPVEDLPEAPIKNLTPRRLIGILGPAVIALGGTIGGGEWLIGPSLFVKWGLVLLWITTISSTLQVFLNLEMVRYTLYTGEPITVGFMRLSPGKTFWGVLFSIVGFIERSMPGWALATATALAAFQLGRIPGASEQGTVIFWGYVVFVVCAFLVSIGGRIERTLEIANWIMMVVVLGGLLILDILVVPASTWGEALVGYVSFGQIPRGVDLLLLGALVGYSAYGGFGNNAITNWYRDKGYGMGKKVGYIPTIIGGTAIHVSPHGNAAPVNEENISRFKGWWKLLNIDQWAIFWGGAMLGMLLPALLYVTMLPRGETLPSWGIAVSPASGLSRVLGPWGFYLIVFFGFWILFSTAISNVDLVCRQITDMLWFASDKVRRWSNSDIRKVYYLLLIAIVIWGSAAMNATLPLILLAISANVANFTMALSAILTIIVNRKFLPREFRPAAWREFILVLCLLFFGFFFTLFVTSQFFGLKF